MRRQYSACFGCSANLMYYCTLYFCHVLALTFSFVRNLSIASMLLFCVHPLSLHPIGLFSSFFSSVLCRLQRAKCVRVGCGWIACCVRFYRYNSFLFQFLLHFRNEWCNTVTVSVSYTYRMGSTQWHQSCTDARAGSVPALGPNSQHWQYTPYTYILAHCTTYLCALCANSNANVCVEKT